MRLLTMGSARCVIVAAAPVIERNRLPRTTARREICRCRGR